MIDPINSNLYPAGHSAIFIASQGYYLVFLLEPHLLFDLHVAGRPGAKVPEPRAGVIWPMVGYIAVFLLVAYPMFPMFSYFFAGMLHF